MMELASTELNKVKLSDKKKFFCSWIGNPLQVGAVAPSGQELARTMASHVECDSDAPVIELGPGTGPVTAALTERGIAEERLILVEYGAEFCAMLHERFPKATIVRGDAYALTKTLSSALAGRACATVSSLPLMMKPPHIRQALLNEALSLMAPGSPFVQFTYALVPPIERHPGLYTTSVSRRIWKNIPPARVWVYRAKAIS